MPEYIVRIKIGSRRCLRPGEEKIWEIFGKNVRIKTSDLGDFWLRHPSALSGVLAAPRAANTVAAPPEGKAEARGGALQRPRVLGNSAYPIRDYIREISRHKYCITIIYL